MQKASDYKPKQSFSLLLQGPPKSGKTTLALQFPRPYVADLDNNLSGTFRWMKGRGMPVDHILYDTPDITEKDSIIMERPIRERYKFLTECLKEAASSTEVDTIIVDGAGKLNSYIIGEIGRQMPTVGEKSARQRKDGEMTLQDWNHHLYLWQNFITKMQATSKMFILTSHEERSDIPDLPGVMLLNIQGKKAQQMIPGMFSDVWRCEVEDKLAGSGRTYQWKVRTMPTSILQLGNSLGLPDVFTMSWEEINKALNKGWEEKKEETK